MIHHCTFEGCLKSVEWPAVFFLPPEGWTWIGTREPGVRDGTDREPHGKAAGGSLSERRTWPGAKAACPTSAQSAPMSRIENIGMTRSQGQPASLNDARRALVNPYLPIFMPGFEGGSCQLFFIKRHAGELSTC